MTRFSLPLALLGLIAMNSYADAAAKRSPPLEVDASVPPPTVPLSPSMKPLFDGKSLDGWEQIPADSSTITCSRAW
jgi:hypothetical protein